MGELDLSLFWFVMLSSSQAAAHSMFLCRWNDLGAGGICWASSSPRDTSPVPALPPTHLLVPWGFFGCGSIPLLIFHKDLSRWLLADQVFPIPLPDSSCIPGRRGNSEWSGEVTSCSDGKFLSITGLQSTDSPQADTVSHRGCSQGLPLLLAPVTPGMTSCIWTRCRKALVSVCTNLPAHDRLHLAETAGTEWPLRHCKGMLWHLLHQPREVSWEVLLYPRRGEQGAAEQKVHLIRQYLVISSHLTLLIVSAQRGAS